MKEIPLFKVAMSPTVPARVSEVLMSGFIGQGKINDEFEEALRGRLGSPFVATTNSATSAEHLAFHLFKQFGLEEGDEVLTTGLSCLATQTPIVANSLKIKWVDVDPTTLNVDLQDLESKITRKTKVLYVVHWGGYPVDLHHLNNIADRAEMMYGFRPFILEDCAHAFASNFNGKPIGSHGNNCTFSFQAIKTLTSIDGGALVTSNAELNRRARLQRWFGIDRDDPTVGDFRCEKDVKIAGHKFHMNDVNACVGLENLSIVDENLAIQKSNGRFYDEQLATLNGAVGLMDRKPGFDSAFWIYSTLVDRRQDFMRMMKDKGIMTSQVHQRNDFNSCFAEFKVELPQLDSVIDRMVNIPCHFGVSEKDRQYILDSIKEGW